MGYLFGGPHNNKDYDGMFNFYAGVPLSRETIISVSRMWGLVLATVYGVPGIVGIVQL